MKPHSVQNRKITQQPSTATCSGTTAKPADAQHPADVARRRVNQPLEAVTLPDALLKLPTVSAAVGLSSASVYRRVAAGEFPQPVKLGLRCTRWRAADIRAWLAAQVPASTTA